MVQDRLAPIPKLKLPDECDKCGEHQAMHDVWQAHDKKLRYCCACYVRSGHPPASWHPVCMSTYRDMTKPDAQKTERN